MELLGTFLLFMVSLVLLLIFLARRDANYFTSRGVLYLWNNTYRMAMGMFGSTTMYENTLEMYRVIKTNHRNIGGMVDFGLKNTIVIDPELLKYILVKDFDHFVDRRMFTPQKGGKLFTKMLFSQRGQRWKDMRSKLSPTFTSGKIKRMFQIIKKSGDRFVNYLEKEIARSGPEIEIGDAYSKMTMDVIASVACGIDSKAFENKQPSLFEQMGNKIRFQFGGLQMLRFLFIAILPKLADLLGMSFFGDEVIEALGGSATP